MANYSLTINSKFQPFSFERYMQPIQIYANLYERQEAAMDALDEKASKWEMLANMAGNEQSYKKYKSYADELKKKADELSTVGLTPQSRRELRELTNKYRTDVQPIEQAYNRWQELEKEQRMFSANNNFNVRYDNDYSTMRLDDLIANPGQSYTAIKGDDVMTKTAALAKQALESIANNPEISEARKGILMTQIRTGATWDQLNRALQLGLQPGQTGDEAVDALLQVARTVDLGYQDNKAYNQEWLWKNISQGLYGGLGSTSYNFMQDPMALNPLQEAQKVGYELQNAETREKQKTRYYGETADGKKVYYNGLSGQYYTKDSAGNIQWSDTNPLKPSGLVTATGDGTTVDGATVTADGTLVNGNFALKDRNLFYKGVKIATGDDAVAKMQQVDYLPTNSSGEPDTSTNGWASAARRMSTMKTATDNNGIVGYYQTEGKGSVKTQSDNSAFGGFWHSSAVYLVDFDNNGAILDGQDDYMTAEQRASLVADLKKKGLTINDVDVYYDTQNGAHDNIAVVLKGTDPSMAGLNNQTKGSKATTTTQPIKLDNSEGTPK